MSQFITSSGNKIEPKNYGAIRLLPAEKAQKYIIALLPKLKEQDGEHVYFLDDGSSGTSDEIFIEVDEAIQKRGNIEGTIFNDILNELYATGHTIRIWYAHNALDDYKNIVECKDILDLKRVLLSQSPTYRARVAANKSLKHGTPHGGAP